MEFYGVEPWGSETEFWRTGLVCAVMANINRDPKKKSTPFTPKDFMPPEKEAREKKLNPTDVRNKFLTAFPSMKRKKRDGKQNDVHTNRGEGAGENAPRDGSSSSNKDSR